MDEIALAKQIISDNIYMVVATASKSGVPWISPVFYGYDEQYNFYWISEKTARHSQLIKENPRVAITIFDSTKPEGEGDAVYLECNVTELEKVEDVREAVIYRDARVTMSEFKVNNISEVTSSGVWRVYKAVPNTVSKLSRGAEVNGQYVDRRIEISLAA